MPRKECNRMDKRLCIVTRLLDGEKMAIACREFGISRKAGFKLHNCYLKITGNRPVNTLSTTTV